MHVCVCVHVCTNVCMSVCVYVCTNVCMSVCVYVCVHVHECMCMCMYVCVRASGGRGCVRAYALGSVCSLHYIHGVYSLSRLPDLAVVFSSQPASWPASQTDRQTDRQTDPPATNLKSGVSSSSMPSV